MKKGFFTQNIILHITLCSFSNLSQAEEQSTACSDAMKTVTALVYKEPQAKNSVVSGGKAFVVICENGVLRTAALAAVGVNVSTGYFSVQSFGKSSKNNSAFVSATVFKDELISLYIGEDFKVDEPKSVKSSAVQKFADLIIKHDGAGAGVIQVYANDFAKQPKLSSSDIKEIEILIK